MHTTRSGPALIVGGIVLGLFIAAVVGVFIVLPLALTHKQTSTLETAYGYAMVNFVTSFERAQPPQVQQSEVTETGRSLYLASCAECHGASGHGEGMFGADTFPPATDLTTAEAQSKSDAQLFWIVKHGLGFTAMPGYSRQYSDAQLGAVVGYIRVLQAGRG